METIFISHKVEHPMTVIEDIEKWEFIPGFDNHQISNHGRLRNIKTNRLLKSAPQSRGYYTHLFYTKERKPKSFLIHRLVAQAFIPNPLNLPEVNHKDFDKSNNHHSNLEWMTPKQNIRHAMDNGKFLIKGKLFTGFKGETNNKAKLKDEEVRIIKSLKGKEKAKILAQKFSVTSNTIRVIWRDLFWKHIN